MRGVLECFVIIVVITCRMMPASATNAVERYHQHLLIQRTPVLQARSHHGLLFNERQGLRRRQLLSGTRL